MCTFFILNISEYVIFGVWVSSRNIQPPSSVLQPTKNQPEQLQSKAVTTTPNKCTKNTLNVLETAYHGNHQQHLSNTLLSISNLFFRKCKIYIYITHWMFKTIMSLLNG